MLFRIQFTSSEETFHTAQSPFNSTTINLSLESRLDTISSAI
jgi:hypothetical protein